MDIATVGGLAAGTIIILVVMLTSGGIMMYWDFLSLMIVVGGALAATLMRWPLAKFINGLRASLAAVFNGVEDPNSLIDEIVDLATEARKNSILALEKKNPSNRFLAKAVKMMVDGIDPAVISNVLDVETASMASRHKDGRGVFEHLGEACPAYGMIGTVIGLIVIMANLSDPSRIGPGLAVALVTTLYGSLIANLVFIPIASKLKVRSEEELNNMRIIKAGVMSLLGGENPRAIRDKLESYL